MRHKSMGFVMCGLILMCILIACLYTPSTEDESSSDANEPRVQLQDQPTPRKDQCDFLVTSVKEASKRYIGEEFPFWYNIGVAKAETNCKWRTSADGHGSIGYFQLTPKFLDSYLRPLFPDYDKPYSRQHVEAAVYYIGLLWKSNPTWSRKLWITYQRYNGGNWVLIECKRAGSSVWDDCYKQCRRKSVCVWKRHGRCLQYRSACEINYTYSKKVYKHGQRWRDGVSPECRYRCEQKFPFW